MMLDFSLPDPNGFRGLAAMVDALPEATAILDHEQKIIMANIPYAGMFGRTPASCVGMAVADLLSSFLSEERLRYGIDAFSRVALTGEPLVLEERSGEVVKRVSISLIRLDDAAPPLFLVCVHDITGQKMARATLAEHVDRFALAMDLVRAGVWEADLLSGRNEWSDMAWKLYGLDSLRHKEPASTELWKSTVHPEDRPDVVSTLEEAVALRSRIDFQYRACHPDGSTHWLQVKGAPFFCEDGAVKSYIGIVYDITERKLAEIEEARFHSHMDFALAQSHVGIWDLDIDNLSVQRTLEHARIFGYQDTVGEWSLERFLAHVVAEDRARVSHIVRQALQAGKGYAFTCRMKRVDGVIRWISVTGSWYIDSRGGRQSVMGVVQDITEGRDAEDARQELESQLLQSQKMEIVGQFAGSIAHDFNNYLTAILGYLEMVLDEVDPSLSYAGRLQLAYKAAQRSSELTRQLLAFARKQEMQPKVLDLNAEIRGLLPIIGQMLEKDVSLRLQLEDAPILISFDPSQLAQVIVNLCINARDAIEGRGILTLKTERIDTATVMHSRPSGCLFDGPSCRLSVSDTGSGIDSKTLPHIFEPFFTTKKGGKGTGLGLATVYGIVRQHNGSITCTSLPGQGTTFTLLFPLEADSDALASIEEREHLHESDEHMLVLLVEDEGMVRALVAKILKENGFMVVAAADAESALRQASGFSRSIDLLLTDVRLPGMNGFQLAEHLASGNPGMRTLFMSGYSEWATDANVLAKPFTTTALLSAVHEALHADGFS